MSLVVASSWGLQSGFDNIRIIAVELFISTDSFEVQTKLGLQNKYSIYQLTRVWSPMSIRMNTHVCDTRRVETKVQSASVYVDKRYGTSDSSSSLITEC